MSKTEPQEEFLSVALHLAQKAAEEIRSFINKPIKKETKADQSPVTQVDLLADKMIRQGLRESFPEHNVLTEETGYIDRSDSEYTWVVDPLDGTKAFARGVPGFCVMIGLLVDEEPQLGVVVDPLTGDIFEAIRGGGTFHTLHGNKKRVRVSSRSEFSEMPLVVSTGFPEEKLKLVLEKSRSPLRDPINSVGVKVGLLVRQVGDIYLNHHEVYYWDTCAPQVILEEAGGIFSKLDGSPMSYRLDGVFRHGMPTLASNGTRHQDLIKMIQDLDIF